jgi:hypothetical protein
VDWPKAGAELKLKEGLLEEPNGGVVVEPKAGALKAVVFVVPNAGVLEAPKAEVPKAEPVLPNVGVGVEPKDGVLAPKA